MLIDLILSKLPTKNQFKQVFNKFSLDNFYFIQDNDWDVLSDKNTDNSMIINITNTKYKKWRYFISIYINKKIENQKLVYFSTAKQLAQIADCDVICCYYDNEIINSSMNNNPFYDFAYINEHWYLIDDINADYANARLEGGEIKIIRCIDKEMEYFLAFGKYLRFFNLMRHQL